MIPSDHFVRFYNEVFKYLEAKGDNHLQDFWNCIGEHQKMHCLELFKTKGLEGMKEYWEKIRVEENCDLEIELFSNYVKLSMHKCPSLTKVMDNDALHCEKYCDHCPGWIKKLITEAGFWLVYNLIARDKPQCESYIFKDKNDAVKQKAILEKRSNALVFTNF